MNDGNIGIGIKSSGLKVNKWVMLEALVTARSLIS
jgi:hypothetical protein